MKKIILIAIILSLFNLNDTEAQVLTAVFQKMKQTKDSIQILDYKKTMSELEDVDTSRLNRIKAELEKYEREYKDTILLAPPRFQIAEDSICDLYTVAEKLPQKMGGIYDQGLEYIIKGKEKKAYKYFEKIIKNKKIIEKDKEHAYYQLAHFDWFGSFDRYYNGTPSNIERKYNTSFVGDVRHGFDKANYKSCLLMCGNPKLVSYNLKLVVEKCCYYLPQSESIYETEECTLAKKVFKEACQADMINNVSLYDIFHEKFYKGKVFVNVYSQQTLDDERLSYIVRLSKCLPYLSRMRQNPDVFDIGKSAKELYSIGEKAYNEKDYIKAFYCFSRGALFGDIKSYLKIYEVSEAQIKYLYNTPKFSKYKSELYDLIDIRNCSWSLMDYISDCKEFSEFEIISKEVHSKINARNQEISHNLKEHRKAKEAKEEAKRERKRAIWLGILQGVGQALASASNYYYMANQPQIANYSSFSQINMPTYNSNYDYLLDPRYAMAQVNAEEQAEYQAAREGAQRVGINLTIDEWRAIQGQALMDLKAQGIDLIAEQNERNRKNRQEFRESLDQERRERLNLIKEDAARKYGVNFSNTSSSNSPRTLSSNTNNRNSNNVPLNNGSFQNQSSYNAQQNDSRQQYKREDVSSDDYKFEKRVTLYIREANRNKIMFSDKDLCRKGAVYYIKIGNTYYLVNQQGGWGFNSSISYGHQKLYFDK